MATERIDSKRLDRMYQSIGDLVDSKKELVQLLRDAEQELHLIRMKDTDAIYDPTLRIRMAAAITKAEPK